MSYDGIYRVWKFNEFYKTLRILASIYCCRRIIISKNTDILTTIYFHVKNLTTNMTMSWDERMMFNVCT